MSRRPYIGPSESQSAALAARDAPYAVESGWTASVAWDWHRREPENLRQAVGMVRKAYADEVPERLHDGPDAIGPDGTPRMSARATGYIFGSPHADDAGRDAETGQRDLLGYYHSPFRAALAQLAQGSDSDRHRAEIVKRVAIGGADAAKAAVADGVPSWCARLVAEDALRLFLRRLSDVRVHLPRVQEGDDVVA